MTDRELIEGIIRRDNAVFREIVNRYQDHVIRTCYSLVHDDQDARDLAQEVFIEILHSAEGFRHDARLSSWIYRISINKSLNHLRLQKRRRFLSGMGLRFAALPGEEEKGRAVPQQPDGDQRMIEKELRNALHAAIGRLPVNQRIAFTLNKYEELSYREIAEVMDLSVSSVESLIHRAKGNLQKILETFYRDNS